MGFLLAIPRSRQADPRNRLFFISFFVNNIQRHQNIESIVNSSLQILFVDIASSQRVADDFICNFEIRRPSFFKDFVTHILKEHVTVERRKLLTFAHILRPPRASLALLAAGPFKSWKLAFPPFDPWLIIDVFSPPWRLSVCDWIAGWTDCTVGATARVASSGRFFGVSILLVTGTFITWPPVTVWFSPGAWFTI